MKAAKKYLLIIGGSLAVALGMVGIFIPVLPTTPFFLLAVYCYLRSSKKLYLWILHHKVFGAYIYHYITFKAVSKRTKIGSMLFLWLGLAVSFFLINNWILRAILTLVGLSVSIHIMTLKTIEKTELETLTDVTKENKATILWKILKKGELQQSTERALKLIRAILAHP